MIFHANLLSEIHSNNTQPQFEMWQMSDSVPREVPTRIAVGVARPRAQGQETTCLKRRKTRNWN